MEFFQNSIFYIELTTLIIYLYFFKKHRVSFYKWFIAYVFFSCLVEFIGGYYKEMDNYWIYNIYTFFEFLCITLIYYSLNKETTSRKIIIYITVIFYIIYFVSFKFEVLQNYTVLILSVFVSFFMLLYLKELLNSNKIMNFKKEISFWITVGFLIYYLGTVPFFSLLYIGGMNDRILFTMLSLIVMIAHFVFIGGLIWSNRIQK